MTELKCLMCNCNLAHKYYYVEFGISDCETVFRSYLCSTCYDYVVDLITKKYSNKFFLSTGR